MEQFYKLTLATAIADHRAGKLTTYGLLDYYVRIKTSENRARKIPLSPKEVCIELGISTAQFRRAIDKIRLGSDTSQNISYTHIDYRFKTVKSDRF